MRPRLFESEVVLPRPRPEVFAFFSDAANLEELTPGWLRFRLDTPPPIALAEGSLIDYRLRVRGVPVRWRTRIAAWEPPRRFVDEQLRGPYRLWHHEHLFEEADGGAATRVIDRVRYAVPGGPLGAVVDRLLVRRDVEAIFAFRTERLRERFGGVTTPRGRADPTSDRRCRPCPRRSRLWTSRCAREPCRPLSRPPSANPRARPPREEPPSRRC